MKVNIIGIIGGILALVSLVLPWWTLSLSSSMFGFGFSVSVDVYTYQATVSGFGMSEAFGMNLWYGWVALALVLIGGIIGIVVSLKPDKSKILAIGGVLILLSMILFAIGLQVELAGALSQEGLPAVGLFGSGSIDYEEYAMNYSAFLSYGFWLALVAIIMTLIASRKKPAQNVAVYPPPPPPPPPS